MQRRHSLKHLLWRGAVYAGSTAYLGSGLYPVAPHIGVAVARRLAGRTQRGGVATLAAEWAVSAALHVARPLGHLGLPLLGPQATGPRPVILLHGYAQNRVNFLVLAERLRRAGIGPLVGFEYWTLGSVEKAASRLARFVDELGAPAVDLVGHSMGGVVARAYVTLGGGAARVRHLITIGSPHNGTELARFGIGTPTTELAASSDFLRRLADAPAPPSVRTTCIWSRADGLVPTSRAARIPGADEVVYDDLGHLALLCSRRVSREVAVRLKMP